MKKSILFMFALAAVLAGCDKPEKQDEKPVNVLKNTDYTGTLTVNASS